MRLRSTVAAAVSITTALVLSPVLGLIAGLAWYELAGPEGMEIAFLLAGLATFVLTAWKGTGIALRLFDGLTRGVPVVLYTLALGAAGAWVVGCLEVSAILMLGHTRPEGLEFNRVLPSMGIAFLGCALVGLLIILVRRRGGH